MSKSPKTVTQRLLERVRILPNGCWQWLGSTSTSGYGRISIEARDSQAHRLSYELFIGPIPEGLDLDHLCRSRPCVNPAHLEPVTRRENLLRGVGASARNARATHCKKGHEFTPENTYRDGARGRRCCRQCSRDNARVQKQRRKNRAHTSTHPAFALR